MLDGTGPVRLGKAPDDRRTMEDVVSRDLTVLVGLLAIAVIAHMIFHRMKFVIVGLTALVGVVCFALATTALVAMVCDYWRKPHQSHS